MTRFFNQSEFRRRSIAIFFALFVFIADQLSKYWVQEHIPLVHSFFLYPYGGIPLFENFFGTEGSLVHAINYGAAWSLLADFQRPLFFFRIFFILGFLFYLFFYNQRKEWVVPSAILIAGAAGNVCDYFLYGHVIDMIHLVFWGYHYPVFNLADSAIFIGVTLLVFFSWRRERFHQSEQV